MASGTVQKKKARNTRDDARGDISIIRIKANNGAVNRVGSGTGGDAGGVAKGSHTGGNATRAGSGTRNKNVAQRAKPPSGRRTSGSGRRSGNPASPPVKTNHNKEQPPVRKNGVEIKGILLTALGVLLMIAFLRDNSIGVFGATVKSVTFGLFGWPAYFVPSAVIIIGFLMILSNKRGRIFGLSSFYIFMLFTITSALFHTIYYNPANYVNQNPFILLGRFYFEAQRLDGTGGGGGFFGALLAMPFINILRVIGTRILLVALLIVDILLLTNVSAAAFLRGVGKTAGQGAQALGNRYRSFVGHNRRGEMPVDWPEGAAEAVGTVDGTGDIYGAEGAGNAYAGDLPATENEHIAAGFNTGAAMNISAGGEYGVPGDDGAMNQEVFIHTLREMDDNGGDEFDSGVRSGIVSFPVRASNIRFSGFNESPPAGTGAESAVSGRDGGPSGTAGTDAGAAFLADHDFYADRVEHGNRAADAQKNEIVMFPIKGIGNDSGRRIKKPPLRWSVTPEGQDADEHARRFFKDGESRAAGDGADRAAAAGNAGSGGRNGNPRNRPGGGAGSGKQRGMSAASASVKPRGFDAAPDPAVRRGIGAAPGRLKAAVSAVVSHNIGGWETMDGPAEEFVFNNEQAVDTGWSSIDHEEAQAEPKKPPVTKAKAKQAAKKTGGTRAGASGTPAAQASAPYRFPPIAFLDENPDKRINMSKLKAQTQETAIKLEEALLSFKVRARVINVTRGPSVTLYEVQPDVGIKVSSIVNLAEDISLKLGVTGIRIEPVADRSAIGIEVPNREVSAVVLRDIVGSDAYMKHQSQLAFAVGVDISGEAVMADISKMPHLLIAGATGSGKSVCVNCLILSLLFKSSPDDVKLIMIDPKVVELVGYNGIPHLMIPVVTDPRKAAGALTWAVQEMLGRYQAFSEKKVKDITGYNAYVSKTGVGEKLPRIVIIIDELSDLMMAAPKEVQDAICRLAQMARAAGMHLVVATQRPTVDVITGLIKANIPSRIAFRVASQTDSRVILDSNGAEKLLGRGDMLFYPVGAKKPVRVQGAYISEAEVERVIDYIKISREVEYDAEMINKITNASSAMDDNPGDNDELLPSVIEHVVEMGQASTSMIQRRFKVGYSRAARIIDQMEARGIVSGFDGSKPRQILITKQQLYEMKM